MEQKEIKIETTDNGKQHWLSFPQVANCIDSIFIDRYVYNNLDNKINFAKLNNIEYTNLKEVEEY